MTVIFVKLPVPYRTTAKNTSYSIVTVPVPIASILFEIWIVGVLTIIICFLFSIFKKNLKIKTNFASVRYRTVRYRTVIIGQFSVHMYVPIHVCTYEYSFI